MNEPVFRYGLFGVGRCVCVHGAILLGQAQQIVALGDESPRALDLACQRLSLNNVARYTEAAAMAETADLDAVVISSHTKDHARHAVPFVRASIPVYLEKPLTDELAEALQFAKFLGGKRNLVQIGLQRRFDPALTYAKSLLAANLIGEIREIRCVLRDQFPPPPTYSSRGLIIDMGIHVADEAIWLTNEFPARVWAKTFEAKDYDSPIDEGGNTAHIGFLTPGGVIGRLDLSRTHSAGYNNETSIIGTKGILNIGRFDGYPGPVHVELWNSDGSLDSSSKSFGMAGRTIDCAEFQPRFQKAYENAHHAFRAAVVAGQDFAVTQMDVLDAQVFVEAAHLSALKRGAEYQLARSENLDTYERLCRERKLLDGTKAST